MKLGPVIKLDKKNTATSKTFDDYIILVNSDVIVFFSIYGQFAVIQKLNFRRMVYKTYIFNNNNFLLAKTENGTKKSPNTALMLLLEVKVLFLPKNAEIIKIKRILVLRGIFSETTYLCVLIYQISSIILTSFRQGEGGNLPLTTPLLPQNEPLKGPP